MVEPQIPNLQMGVRVPLGLPNIRGKLCNSEQKKGEQIGVGTIIIPDKFHTYIVVKHTHTLNSIALLHIEEFSIMSYVTFSDPRFITRYEFDALMKCTGYAFSELTLRNFDNETKQLCS